MNCIVAVTLALLMDISTSMSLRDYNNQLQFTAEALRSPEISSLIEKEGGIQVIAIGFGSDQYILTPWTVLRNRTDIESFAAQLIASPRPSGYQYTLTGEALQFTMQRIEQAPCEGDRTTIDVSTDGLANGALPVSGQRDIAESRNIRINGIGIGVNARENPSDWMRRELITSDGFAFDASTWEEYARAIRRKIVFDITWVM